MSKLIAMSISELDTLIGENRVRALCNGFSSPLNLEVESFLKDKARQSAALSSSVTYLVLDENVGHALGYFTLLLKSFSVNEEVLSSANRRLIGRFARRNETTGEYAAAVYLIAQLGRNFAVPKECGITGKELIDLALEKLRIAQSTVGGKLALVERDRDRPKLLDFYRGNGFRSWNARYDKDDGITYDQMVRVIEPATVAEAAR